MDISSLLSSLSSEDLEKLKATATELRTNQTKNALGTSLNGGIIYEYNYRFFICVLSSIRPFNPEFVIFAKRVSV